MKKTLSGILPEAIKSRLRPFLNGPRARRLAATSKRMDVCAAQLAHVLHLADHPPLADKTCLEIGAGWVLSHALLCHLLGAKKVIAADIYPLAHPQYLSTALRNSVSYILADVLSPFENHALLRDRVRRLMAVSHFSFQVLEDLGIEYVSPLDLAQTPLGQRVDFIFSTSVLEHVPVEDAPRLLEHLGEALTEHGTMVHCIHLEDHQDFEKQPFDFLARSADEYPRWRQTNTGNRIRASGWQKLFDQLGRCESRPLYAFRRTDVRLPHRIDDSIVFTDETDLRTSHLGMFTRKCGAIS